MTVEKIFIMYMKGLVVPRGNATSGDDEWKTFEEMMCRGLKSLDFSFNEEIAYFGDHFEEMDAADFVIYAHKTRRDLFADLYFKQMHMRYLFTLDHLGWGADHSGVLKKPDFEFVEEAQARDFCTSRRQQFLTLGDSKFRQPERDAERQFPDDFIFYPLQRPGDDTIMFHSPKEVAETMVMLSQWANSRKQNLVVKLHPGNKNDQELLQCVKECENKHDHVFVLDGNIHDFIDRSKGVVVINSGVGFESLIHGKPVVTLGGCDYQWVTFNATETTLDEARDYIFNFTETQKIKGWQFIYYYFFHHAYCIEPAYKEAAYKRLYEYLQKKVKARLSVFEN